MYNHPKMLDRVLPLYAGKPDLMERDKLVFICSVLQRTECRKILLSRWFPEHVNLYLSDIDQQNELFHILLNYSCCRDEIVSLIQGYKNIKLPYIGDTDHNNYQANLNCLVNKHCYRWINSVELIQFMTVGDEIDLIGCKIEHLHGVFRELVELCLFSNLSNLSHLAEQTVNMYLKHYHRTDLRVEIPYNNLDLIFKESHAPGKIEGEYIMDANEHFLFNGENFALNFILPLFIECGFPLKRNLIDNILHNEEVSERLHPAETEYLIQSLECPTSLQLCCRDSLRRHFKNRQIHRYVSISTVPNQIKDFVLLKTVLPTLKYTKLHAGQ